MTKTSKTKERWEESFDEEFMGSGETIYSGTKTPQYIKDFIKSLLKKEREKDYLKGINKIPSDYLDFKTKNELEERNLMIKLIGREKFEIQMTGRREVKNILKQNNLC